MMVLFIDDDPDDYEIFCQGLKECHPGAKCLHALNGEAAIDLLNELIELPDYIFMDINMPRMGGKECLTKMKGNSRLKDIPVIIYSTTTQQAEINSYKALGARDFINKPSTVRELVKIIRATLQ